MGRNTSLVVLLAALGSPAAAQEKAEPTVGRIRSLLNVYEFKEERLELIRMGEVAFPAYEQILNDPAANYLEVVGIFNVLGVVQADRRRFVEQAVRRLADPDQRRSAVGLLGRIGSRGDASPVVALLWDREESVRWAAVEALGRLGGERELLALEIWAKSQANSFRADERLRQHVQKSRDAMQRRIEEEKKKQKVN
jgi:HEAT repeat protein